MNVYIIGCGGNAKIVVDICELNNYTVMGFFDDKYDANNKQIIYHKYHICGKISDIRSYSNINVINSIGDCSIRETIYNNLRDTKINWINCIHPQSYVAQNVILGKGNIICYGSVINSDAIIGNFNLINTCAIIEHDCIIGNFNHIAPKTTLCGSVIIGHANLIGAGTTIIPGKSMGSNNTVGAMSAIIRNIFDNQTVVGVPGKVLNEYIP